MAETTLDLRHLPKAEAYAQLDAHVRAVLAGVDDPVTAMATVSCLVHHAFGHLWTGFYRVVATYGFMESPDVPEVMRFLNARGIRARPAEISYYLGRERLLPTGSSKMARWRKAIFIVLSRNARSATEFFNIPPNRVVELGTQIEF